MSNGTLNYYEIHRTDKKLGHLGDAGAVRRGRISISRKMFMFTSQGDFADCENALDSHAFGILAMFVFPSCKPSFHVKHAKACASGFCITSMENIFFIVFAIVI